jgi:N-acetylmuramoyl-L-alanine amidase
MKRVLLIVLILIPLFSLFSAPVYSYPLSTIIIDAGHGGEDPGAVGSSLLEKNITLAIAKNLEALCVEKGVFIPVLTRENDTYITLDQRVGIAQNTFPGWNSKALFVSIHVNASSASSASGFEFLVKPSGALAPIIGEQSSQWAISYFAHDKMSQLQRSLNEENYLLGHFMSDSFTKAFPATTNRGIKEQEVWVLNQNIWPSVLVEVGFISNPEEQEMMKSEEWITSVSEAIYQGIISYNN